ncbi:MAG: hypothetical protein U0350_50215 [Caldilineaceae bacterium]
MQRRQVLGLLATALLAGCSKAAPGQPTVTKQRARFVQIYKAPT